MEMLAQLMSRALRTSNRFFLDSTTAIPLANHQSTSSQAHVLLPEQDASNVLQGMRAVFGKNQAAQHSQRQLDQQSDLLRVPSDAGLDFRHTHATQDPSKSSARQRGLFKRAPSIASRAMSSASQQTESHVTSAFGRLPSSVAIERKPSTTNGPLKPISFLTAGGADQLLMRIQRMQIKTGNHAQNGTSSQRRNHLHLEALVGFAVCPLPFCNRFLSACSWLFLAG